jgi:hypothetical protein
MRGVVLVAFAVRDFGACGAAAETHIKTAQTEAVAC